MPVAVHPEAKAQPLELGELLLGRYYDPPTDQFMSVDPLVEMTGQPYAFAGDDPLNASDPLGLYQSGPGTAECQHQNGTVSCTGALPSGQSVTGTYDPSSGASTGAFAQSTIPSVVTARAATAAHEGANSTDAIGSNEYAAISAAEFENCTGLAHPWACHQDVDALNCSVAKGTSFGSIVVFLGGTAVLVAVGPLGYVNTEVAEYLAEDGTEEALSQLAQAKNVENTINNVGKTLAFSGGIGAALSSGLIPAFC